MIKVEPQDFEPATYEERPLSEIRELRLALRRRAFHGDRTARAILADPYAIYETFRKNIGGVRRAKP